MPDRKYNLIYYIGLGGAFALGLIFYAAVISGNRGDAAMARHRAESHLDEILKLCRSGESAGALEKKIAEQRERLKNQQSAAEKLAFALPADFEFENRSEFEGRQQKIKEHAVASKRFADTQFPLGFTVELKSLENDNDEDARKVKRLTDRLAVARRILDAVLSAKVEKVNKITHISQRKTIHHREKGLADYLELVPVKVEMSCDEKSLAAWLHTLQKVDESGNAGHVGLRSIRITVKGAPKNSVNVTAVVQGAFLRKGQPAQEKQPGGRSRPVRRPRGGLR